MNGPAIAPCGDEFDTDRDAQDHAHHCGACAGADEAAHTGRTPSA